MADDAPDAPGAGLVRIDVVGTVALVATSVAAAVSRDAFGVPHAVLSGVLFVAGIVALLWAFALGVARSRTELVTVPGLFLLARPTAPGPTRRTFHVALGVQVIAVVVAASIWPFTEVAFGILAPTFGLGLMALWGGRHGEFPVRDGSSSS